LKNKASHKERAHSKYSASGSEKWLNCPASVALEEQSPPSADTPWSLEGTLAHEILEQYLKAKLNPKDLSEALVYLEMLEKTPVEMQDYVEMAGDRMLKIAKEAGAVLISEQRIYNTIIDEEMFGTTDGAVVQHFGTLHIIDFKYGKGHIVSPEKNTQLLQYALGYAEKFNWNFYDVKLHILQPRSGEGWHKTWGLTMRELKDFWLPIFKKGVARTKSSVAKSFEGNWCYWCRAKAICPVKRETSLNEIASMFESNPLTERQPNGFQEKSPEEKSRYQKSNSKKKNRFIESGDENKTKGKSKGDEEEKDFF
jgi:hypothetical protein